LIPERLPPVKLGLSPGSMTEEELGQPRGQLGKDNNKDQADQLEDDKGHDAPVNVAHRVTLRSHSRKIKQGVSKRRCQK